MKKWLLIDSKGEVRNAVISPEIPSLTSGYNTEGMSVVEVEEFKPLNLFKYQNGWVERLSESKTQAVGQVNRWREKQQLQFLTDGTGKTFSYFQKAQEVARAESASAENFPFAEAQAQLTGQTVEEVLEEFRQGLQAATDACAEIEARAMVALKEIHVAESISEVEAVLNQFESS